MAISNLQHSIYNRKVAVSSPDSNSGGDPLNALFEGALGQ
jgi:hypothetical protein